MDPFLREAYILPLLLLVNVSGNSRHRIAPMEADLVTSGLADARIGHCYSMLVPETEVFSPPYYRQRSKLINILYPNNI